MSCTKFDQLVEAVAKKKGCRQAQVESTGHKNHRQNKRATGEKKTHQDTPEEAVIRQLLRP